MRDRRLQKVGEIFVPDKTDRARHVERWVLYPDYVYPSTTNSLGMRGQPARQVRSDAEFFARSFPAGSPY